MVSQQDVDLEWAKLADSEVTPREAAMLARYNELAGLSEDERRSRLRSMARAEYELSDAKLRPFTVSRMRTWLELDPTNAQLIASSYDAVMQEMPAPVAMRRVALVQSLAIEFSVDDEDRLRKLTPRVFAGAPSRKTGLAREETSLSMADSHPKRSWWAFWRRN